MKLAAGLPRAGVVALVAALLLVPAGLVAATTPSVTRAPTPGALVRDSFRPLARPAGGSAGTIEGATLLATALTHDAPTCAVTNLANQYLYVTNYGSIYLGGNTVSVINPANQTTLATIGTGDDPIDAVYDPSDQDVYVTNYGATDNVTIIHSEKVVANPATGYNPDWAIYDPADQDVYVGNTKSANLSVFSGTSVIASVPVGSEPLQMAFDPVNDYLYVPNAGSGNVSIVHGKTVIGSVGAGTNPVAATYDPLDEEVYITNIASGNVTIINGTTSVGSVAVGLAPFSAVYDPSDGSVYVSDGGSNSVTVVHGTTSTANISVGVYPRFLAYDAQSGNVYVAEWSSNNVAVLNGTQVVAYIAVGTEPYTVDYDPLDDEIAVPNTISDNMSLIGSPTNTYAVTVSTSGMAVGVPWQFGWGPTLYGSTGASLAFPSVNGTFNTSVPPPAGYLPVEPNGSATVAGAPLAITVAFYGVFPIQFKESGLLAGTPWQVVLSNASGTVANLTGTGGVLAVDEPNGSYSYALGLLSTYQEPRGGNFTIAGAGVNVSLAFTLVTYEVQFDEVGLPTGSSWTVTIGNNSQGSRGPSVSFTLPNGSYSYSLSVGGSFEAPHPTGAFRVDGGGLDLKAQFNETYLVEFRQTGLPEGALWTVVQNGSGKSSFLSEIYFSEPNGSYLFDVRTPAPGWVANNSTPTVRVAGAAQTVFEQFTNPRQNATPYELVFVETGLAPGTPWNVTVGDAFATGDGTQLGVWLGNNTYYYLIQSAGYFAYPARGELTIAGPPARFSVDFTEQPVPHYGVTLVPEGLAPGARWNLTVNGTTLAGLGGVDVNLSLESGTYPYSVAGPANYAFNRSGDLYVIATPQVVPIRFALVQYAVTFRASGLPANALWILDVSGRTVGSQVAEATVLEPNGSYGYSVAPPSGYAIPPRGGFVVDGASPPAIAIAFVLNSSSSGSPNASGTAALPAATMELAVGLGAVAVAAVAVLVLSLRRRPPTELAPYGAHTELAAAGPGDAAEVAPEPWVPETPEPEDPGSG